MIADVGDERRGWLSCIEDVVDVGDGGKVANCAFVVQYGTGLIGDVPEEIGIKDELLLSVNWACGGVLLLVMLGDGDGLSLWGDTDIGVIGCKFLGHHVELQFLDIHLHFLQFFILFLVDARQLFNLHIVLHSNNNYLPYLSIISRLR